MWDKIKKVIRESLEKMAKENEKNFGNGKLDCCQLHRKDKTM